MAEERGERREDRGERIEVDSTHSSIMGEVECCNGAMKQIAMEKGGMEMKKYIVLVEMKTTEEAFRAVLEMDEAVRESAAALDSGMVRPSASGMIRCASGMIRDASGMIRDASGLIRDASELVRDDKTAERYRILAEKVQDLSGEAVRFSRYMRNLVDLAATEDVSGLERDVSVLIENASGMIRNASGMIRDVYELVKGTTAEEGVKELVKKADDLRKRADNLESEGESVTDSKALGGAGITEVMLEASGMIREASGMIREASGMIRGFRRVRR